MYQTLTTQGTCQSLGGGTVTFTASGPAIGPYPGTYTETGTVTISPTLVSFSSQFTITSGTTTVTGTKWNPSPFQALRFTCNDFINIYIVDATVRYQATISSESGTAQDSGQAEVNLIDYRSADQVDIFSESFELSDQLVSAITLAPAAATNPVGTSHTVTAAVYSTGTTPRPGADVYFTVAGAVNTSGSCTTGSTGTCTFTYNSPQLPGADLITGCADSDDDGTVETGEPCATATKAWLLPASQPGQVTGGGHILPPGRTRPVAFGFNAQAVGNKFQGQGNVVDQSMNVKITILTVSGMIVDSTRTHATFFADETINGTPTPYRIDVDDRGEPGEGVDTFTIQTATGYTASGPLTNGNIQIHEDQPDGKTKKRRAH